MRPWDHHNLLKASLHPRHNDRPIRQQHDKEHLPQLPFDRVRKADEPERYRLRPKFLSLQRADLYVVKGRHAVGSDLSRFLFGYSRWENSVHRPQKRTALIIRRHTQRQGQSVEKSMGEAGSPGRDSFRRK